MQFLEKMQKFMESLTGLTNAAEKGDILSVASALSLVKVEEPSITLGMTCTEEVWEFQWTVAHKVGYRDKSYKGGTLQAAFQAFLAAQKPLEEKVAKVEEQLLLNSPPIQHHHTVTTQDI